MTPPTPALTTGDIAPLFEPLALRRGPALRNRFMLAPLTNMQSHADGTLSDAEYTWLTMRAQGGFAATMTAAAHVQAVGQGFAGQLGVFSDLQLPGLTRLATGIKTAGSMALLQLHHAGTRSPRDVIGTDPVSPSGDPDTGARALDTGEVMALVADFAAAARRAQDAGFDGVEIHGAHGYIVSAFLSPQSNRRTDEYGGTAAKRARLLWEIVDAIRAVCRPDFVLGVRLSPERFGLVLSEVVELAGQLLTHPAIDFLDMSLWDCFKRPADEPESDRLLIDHFAALPREAVRLGVAGKITHPADALRVLELGADIAIVGRAAIIHHDYPLLLQANPGFVPLTIPVTSAHLRAEGLSDRFIGYVNTGWPGFVVD